VQKLSVEVPVPLVLPFVVPVAVLERKEAGRGRRRGRGSVVAAAPAADALGGGRLPLAVLPDRAVCVVVELLVKLVVEVRLVVILVQPLRAVDQLPPARCAGCCCAVCDTVATRCRQLAVMLFDWRLLLSCRVGSNIL